MNTITMNKSDWSGEIATIEYSDAGEFSINGYDFRLEIKEDAETEAGAIAFLHGEGWSTPLHSFIFLGNWSKRLPHLNEPFSLEEAVRRAAVYVFNHV